MYIYVYINYFNLYNLTTLKNRHFRFPPKIETRFQFQPLKHVLADPSYN